MILSNYNPADWYWVIAGSTSMVYSSKRVQYVPVGDMVYQAWLDSGLLPTIIVSEQSLIEVLQQQYPAGWPQTLAQQAATALADGYTVAVTGSFTLSPKVFPTDPDSLMKLANVVNVVTATRAFPGNATSFPMRDRAGAWHTFTIPQYLVVAGAIANYVASLTMIIDGNPLNVADLPASSITLTI